MPHSITHPVRAVAAAPALPSAPVTSYSKGAAWEWLGASAASAMARQFREQRQIFFFSVWLSLSLPRRITGRLLFVLCLLGKLLSLNLDVFKIKLTVVLS